MVIYCLQVIRLWYWMLSFGKLISAAASAVNNNYFDLVVEPSPDYATLNAPSHMLVKSAEADGKSSFHES